MKHCVVCAQPIAGQKQKYCGNACKQKDHHHRVKAQTNTYHSQTLRSLKRKLQLIEQFGGGCQKCGYQANAAALHFHHSDPTMKSIKLDMRVLSNRNWDVIVAVHNPELTFQNIRRILSGASRPETTG